MFVIYLINGYRDLSIPTVKNNFFRVLACIFIKLSTSNYCTHKIDKYLQHYPPSPPQGGDGFDHCIIYGLRLYSITNYTACHILQ
jgi:hypothetical protein